MDMKLGGGGEGPIQFGDSTINLFLGWVVQYIFSKVHNMLCSLLRELEHKNTTI